METFSGSIDPGFNYMIEVEYIATKYPGKCKERVAFGGMSPKRISRYYFPDIESDTHRITFPRNEVSSQTLCQWQAISVDICVGDLANPTDNWCSSFLDLATVPFRVFNDTQRREIANPELPLKLNCEIYESTDLWVCGKRKKTSNQHNDTVSNDKFPLKLPRTGGIYQLDISVAKID